MIVEETINKLIRDIIDLLLVSPGYTIKTKQKDAPRPIGAYSDVEMVTITGIGWEQKSLENNSGDPDVTETLEGYREILMSINFYREEAMDTARMVRMALLRSSILSIFNGADIGLVSRTEVKDLSEPLEDGFEKRAQFDIVLSAIGTDTDIVRAIESVTISGKTEFGKLKSNFNIEV